MFDHISKGRWWDIGLQLVEGCTKVSPGCDNCWSLTAANMRRFNPNPKMAARYEGVVDYHLDSLDSPDQQCRECQDPQFECEGPCRPQWTGQVNPQWQDIDKIGRARNPQVYTFWTDLFHPGVPDEFIDEVMKRITGRLEHFYIICTKRPERAFEFYSHPSRSWVGNAFQKSLMIMTTVENQKMADLRLPILLEIPGVMHAVSMEPALGIVDFCQPFARYLREIDWVICGGETGPRARPMHPDWVRSLRDQCTAANVPFFLKSRGEWSPVLSLLGTDGPDFRKTKGKKENSWGTLDFEGNWFPLTSPWNGNQGNDSAEREYVMYRIGKKAAGRLLDGRTWDEVPNV